MNVVESFVMMGVKVVIGLVLIAGMATVITKFNSGVAETVKVVKEVAVAPAAK